MVGKRVGDPQTVGGQAGAARGARQLDDELRRDLGGRPGLGGRRIGLDRRGLLSRVRILDRRRLGASLVRLLGFVALHLGDRLFVTQHNDRQHDSQGGDQDDQNAGDAAEDQQWQHRDAAGRLLGRCHRCRRRAFLRRNLDRLLLRRLRDFGRFLHQHRRRGFDLGLGRRRRNLGHARLQIGIGDFRQVLLDRIDRFEVGQTFFRVIAVLRQVLVNRLFEQGMLVFAERFLLAQNLREPLLLGLGPCVHGGDQHRAADEFLLARENAREQIAITHRIRHGTFLVLLRGPATPKQCTSKGSELIQKNGYAVVPARRCLLASGGNMISPRPTEKPRGPIPP